MLKNGTGTGMNMFDMKTVMFGHVLTDIVCALVMVSLWVRNRQRYHGLSFWVADYLLQLVAVLAILLRGTIPDVFSFMLGNPLIVAGALAMLMGLERFVGKPGPQVHNLILLGGLVLVQAYTGFVNPSLTARSLTVTVGILLMTSQCMWLLLRRVEGSLRPITRGLGLVFAGYSLVSLLRVVLLIFAPHQEGDFFKSGNFETLMILAYQMLFILQTTSLVLMVNRRLLLEVQSQEERFTKAFHSSPYALTITRLRDGKILEVNEGFVAITGYPFAEVLGRTTVELGLWGKEEERRAVVEALSRDGRVRDLTCSFRTKTGEGIVGLFSADIVIIDGDPCVLSSILDVTARVEAEKERERLIGEVKTLKGLLPICSHCKNIRDEEGSWTQMETYIGRHSQAEFSHGICPDCLRRYYPDLAEEILGER